MSVTLGQLQSTMLPSDRRPRCDFCDDPKRAAYYLAAQSVNQGRTTTWGLVCENHIQGWNDGGDWDAPIFRLVAP